MFYSRSFFLRVFQVLKKSFFWFFLFVCLVLDLLYSNIYFFYIHIKIPHLTFYFLVTFMITKFIYKYFLLSLRINKFKYDL